MLLDSIEGEAEGDVSLVLVPETVDLVYAWASSIISSTSFLYCNRKKGYCKVINLNCCQKRLIWNSSLKN